MNLTTLLFREGFKVVSGLSPRTPSTTTPRYVSMKGSSRLAILVQVFNGQTVTGSAITLKQATAVAGTGEKTLGLTSVWRNLDTEAAGGDTLTLATVALNTFTTDTTDDKSLLYVIEVDASQLDLANRFDCVRLGTGDGAATTIGALYLLYPVTGNPPPSAVSN